MTSEPRTAAITADSRIQVKAGVLAGVLWGLTWTGGGYVANRLMGHESRIVVLEEREAASKENKASSDRRLERIEAKIDALMERRP